MQHCPPLSLHSTSLVPTHSSDSSKVSLSKTVIQSLPRSLSLSICQSAVSHSLIQSVPRILSLSVSRSFSHSMPLSLFAHLTSSSFTHLHLPLIHHSTRLGRFFNCQQLTSGQSFSSNTQTFFCSFVGL